MEVSLVRAVTIKSYKGGLGGFWKFIMMSAFFSESSHDYAKSGINLQLVDGSSRHLWLDLRFVLADEAALHSLYGCKGASGIKCCMLCSNICNVLHKERQIVERDRARVARYSNTPDFDALVLHTSESISAIMAKLELNKALASPDLEELEKLLGWNYLPHGAMADPSFRQRIDPPSRVTFDGMHVFYVNGVFNQCVGRLLWHFRNAKIPLSALEAYAKVWIFPRALGQKSGIAEAFSPDRLASSLKAGTFKATASEGLGVYPILAQFCYSRLHLAAVAPHCQCFLLLARCLGLWQRAARKLSTAAELKDAAVEFLRCYSDLYGPDSMSMVKFHMILHLPIQFDRVLSCWVHERKHKGVKKYANELRNTSWAWDTSVLRDVTSEHLAKLKGMPANHFCGEPRLDHPSRPSRRVLALLQQVFSGDALTFLTAPAAVIGEYREKVSVTDVALLRSGEIAKVLWHVSVQDGSGALFF